MDPNIMKLLEEDEDETMHSGADVDAFQAALNRDIAGDSSASQPSGSGSILPHESNQTSGQSFPNWETTRQDANIGGPSQQESKVAMWEQQEDQHPSVMEPKTVATWEQQEEQHPSVMEPKTVASAENQRPQGGAQVQQVGPEQAPFQTPQTTPLQIPETNPVPGSLHGKQQISHNESQYLMSPKMGNQQTTAGEQGGNQKSGKQVAFVTLLPALLPHLDKDREMQLQTLFSKLRRNEIPKENFVRLVRNIVGDQVLKLAVQQLQAQQGSNQSQQSQALARKQNVRMPASATATRYTDPRPYALQPRGSSSTLNPLHNTPSVVHVQTDSSYSFGESNAKKSHETERQLDSHGMQGSQMPSSSNSLVNQERERNSVSNQGQIKEQPQQLHLPQTSFPMYGTTVGNYHQFSGASVGTTGSSMNQQPYDLQMRQNSVNEPNRAQSGNTSHFPNKAVLQQNSISWQTSQNKEQNSAPLTDNVKQEPVEQASEQQHKSQLSNLQGMSIAAAEQGNTISGNVKDAISVSPSFTSSLESNVQVGSRIPTVASSSGNNTRTPPKKPSIGQKKPLEALGSSPPMASNKKQKVSGALSDQSIEQLNDVTAVSGVNLREEEEQLFSGSKEDSRVSEASRRVVQEEEERLILQKTPLQKKLAEIMGKCGLKNVSNDVERCLSLCVEERMRGLISNLIKLSKQRADTEKLRHRTIITSDVRQQIVTINRKAREEWEKKQAEAEKLRKVNEPEGDSAVEGDKEKDEGRAKSVKVNKEEDDKMRTTAANVAARAAVGGDDMLSKWQLMAEQARQKREGGMEAASVSQPGKDVSRRLLSASGRQMKDSQETEKRSPSALISSSGAIRKFGRNQVTVPQVKVAQNISFKDVIAALEREPQMSKSTLIYQLYERIQSDTATE